jgi:hypothetical protein
VSMTTNNNPARQARQPVATRKEIRNFWSRQAAFQQQNLAAASVILQDIGRYGGETAGLIIWARLTLARHTERRAA